MSSLHKLNIILASASPRRIEMFHDHGVFPVVIPSDATETTPMPLPPKETALFLALKKALSVKEQGHIPHKIHQNCIIIAADTLVFKEEILGKPVDKADAKRILSLLSGTSHQVVTGVALLSMKDPFIRLFVEESSVTFYPYTSDEIESYLDTPEPYDKAGAYGIQGTFAKYIKEVQGDKDNVIGLPWNALERELIELSF
jgi:septum formation protein